MSHCPGSSRAVCAVTHPASPQHRPGNALPADMNAEHELKFGEHKGLLHRYANGRLLVQRVSPASEAMGNVVA